MYLELITPDAKAFEGEVQAVKVPGINGEFEMLNKHADIISALTKGNVRITIKGGETKNFMIDGGTVELLNNKITILAEAIIG
ncbi:ATP synthase F1 subunit epsilon [Limibacter armeniacum]|uniref:ATP synthase F1 subunit epsilon n=1 Tax=Limibacter armeniacum TaxID=466084 RepID=UPI002FE59064